MGDRADESSPHGIAQSPAAMQPLPIDASLEEIRRAIEKEPALVLEAPPGAGKTTRVPRALFEAPGVGSGQVIVTEPRRLAARLAADRVASEHGERLGELVGYTVRFEDVGGPNTKIRYVTEGLLLRRLMADPVLSNVSLVVLDEFHERHLQGDLLLTLLKRMISKRARAPKLVVMSATLDAEPVAQFLGDCPRIRSVGRAFPVVIEHLREPDLRPLEKQVVSAVRRVLREGPTGDILVFLPGAAEIRGCLSALSPLASEAGFSLAPLHGDLSVTEQARAIAPDRRSKIVLSTNVAESSVTIEGVVAVIDSGLVRRAGHSPWSGLPTLTTGPISRASAAQRAGRAGRTREGFVLRLYTEGDLQTRPEFDPPEIARADLTEARLILAQVLGTSERIDRLDWLTAPPPVALQAAEELLSTLGALGPDQELTSIGERLLELPLHPRLGRLVIEGERLGVTGPAVLAAALLGERDVRLSQRRSFSEIGNRTDRATGASDLQELVDAFELARSLDFESSRLRAHDLDARSVSAVRRAERQLRQHVPSRNTSENPEQALLMATLAGFSDRLARRKRPGSAELILASGATARLSPESVVREAELVVAVEVDEQGSGKFSRHATVRLASSVRAEWLLDSYAERLRLDQELLFNEQHERVERVSRLRFGAVVLEESRAPAEPGSEAARVLLAAAQGQGALEFTKSDGLTSLLERCTLLATQYPGAGFSPFDPASLLERAVEGRTSFAELREAELCNEFLKHLSPEQRRLLERETPETVRLPSGRSTAIYYQSGRSPWLQSRLQDFFGLAEGPRLCSSRVPVTLHLLAPNGRSVQVTTDLAGFWERHYPGLRRELMRRYPKHAWPEDGRSARPPPVKR